MIYTHILLNNFIPLIFLGINRGRIFVSEGKEKTAKKVGLLGKIFLWYSLLLSSLQLNISHILLDYGGIVFLKIPYNKIFFKTNQL